MGRLSTFPTTPSTGSTDYFSPVSNASQSSASALALCTDADFNGLPLYAAGSPQSIQRSCNVVSLTAADALNLAGSLPSMSDDLG